MAMTVVSAWRKGPGRTTNRVPWPRSVRNPDRLSF